MRAQKAERYTVLSFGCPTVADGGCDGNASHVRADTEPTAVVERNRKKAMKNDRTAAAGQSGASEQKVGREEKEALTAVHGKDEQSKHSVAAAGTAEAREQAEPVSLLDSSKTPEQELPEL